LEQRWPLSISFLVDNEKFVYYNPKLNRICNMAKKKKKMPKRPKMNSSKQTWDRWAKRAAEVKKYNDQIDKDREYKRKLSQKF
jgi:hypothetical protein